MSKFLLFVISLVLVGAATFVPEVGPFFLAPALALLIGAIAAYRAASRAEMNAASAGVWASVVVGLGAMIGVLIAVTIFGTVLAGQPSIQELVRSSEPHPEARIPYEWIQPLGAATGFIVGLIAGVGELILAVVGGVFGALVGSQRHGGRSVAAR